MRSVFARGFTLVELLSVVSISTILMSIATPNLHYVYTKAERDDVIARTRSGLSAARYFAITKNQVVTFCGINEEKECANSDIKSLLVFMDTNKNAAWDEGEARISEAELSYNGQLQMRASLQRTYIRFNQTGSAKQAGSFLYCNEHYDTLNSRVTVSMAGRVYTSTNGIKGKRSGVTCS